MNLYEETKFLMKKYNINANKNLGQNFLINEDVINKIVQSSYITENDIVIEIGPGLGTLTNKLLEKAKKVIAIEIDERMIKILKERFFMYNNFELLNQDVLKVDLKELIEKNKKEANVNCVKVVANLPYYITTPIITKLFNELSPDKMILMVQNEVALRLCAHSGTRDYGMISALFSSKYTVNKLFNVSRKCFIPEPNVDSAVIAFEKHEKFSNVSYDVLTKLLKDAFQFKRKNLRNNLKNYDLSKIETILSANNYDLTNRAEDIPIELFIEIANNL